jgi:hypothetical protein
MSAWSRRAWTGQRLAEGETAHDPGAGRPSGLAACWRCLPLCLLVLAAGCTHRPSSTSYYEVSGLVTFKGKPLPGGRVNFVATTGGFAGGTNIGQDGHYKLQAPVGEVHISVDNSMLEHHRGQPMGAIQSEGMLKHSSGEKEPVQGHYIDIPRKYADAAQSGLTYTVQAQTQTFDIKLE